MTTWKNSVNFREQSVNFRKIQSTLGNIRSTLENIQSTLGNIKDDVRSHLSPIYPTQHPMKKGSPPGNVHQPTRRGSLVRRSMLFLSPIGHTLRIFWLSGLLLAARRAYSHCLVSNEAPITMQVVSYDSLGNTWPPYNIFSFIGRSRFL
jgi:hypothetical protein